MANLKRYPKTPPPEEPDYILEISEEERLILLVLLGTPEYPRLPSGDWTLARQLYHSLAVPLK